MRGDALYIFAMSLFPPFDPDQPEQPRRRGFRPIPVRTLAPNVITLLALCAGLTAIRIAAEGRYDLALAAIIFAAILDGIDGRLARILKGTSRFGAELDSLADFVNFGVAPALILWFWGLHEVKAVGWIAAIVFAICVGLRLARFNVMIEDPSRPPGRRISSSGYRRRAGRSRSFCRFMPISWACPKSRLRSAWCTRWSSPF